MASLVETAKTAPKLVVIGLIDFIVDVKNTEDKYHEKTSLKTAC
ncbi:hypothetical protein MCEMEM6_00446 [Methylophilaceae bacterium]